MLEEDFFIESHYPKHLLGCRLIRTCMACPEQYDVLLDNIQIGYLRLRHGKFTAKYVLEHKDVLVYEASPEGDGIFLDNERYKYLLMAVQNLLNYHSEMILEMDLKMKRKNSYRSYHWTQFKICGRAAWLHFKAALLNSRKIR